MIELGKKQKLQVVRKDNKGYYLNLIEKKEYKNIFLPMRLAKKELEPKDIVDVFVYKDSKGEVIATMEDPKLQVGEIGYVKVAETTKIGAFLNIGLDKDVLLPFTEQKGTLKKGKSCLVTIYLDKSERLCATMDIQKFLSDESPYKAEDVVTGVIYSMNKAIGAFIAIDGKYNALIPSHEIFDDLNIGDKITARVERVKPDGKLDLTLRKKAYKQMEDDSSLIMEIIEIRGGHLNLNDNSSPDEIKSQFNMSKNSFKRAVGKLLKEGKIEITERGISKK